MEIFFLPIVYIIGGVLFFLMTYKDGKKIEAEFSTAYISHLKGYLAGIGFFILGVIMLFRNL